MTLCKAYLAITLLMFAGNTVAFNEVDTGDCMYNCSTMVEIGQTYHVVARGADGKIFYLKDTNVETEGTTLTGSDEITINSNEITINSNEIMNNSTSSFVSSGGGTYFSSSDGKSFVSSGGGTSFASSGGTGESRVRIEKHETATHWIIIFTIEYYDENGELIDVEVIKSKVPKPTSNPDFGDT